jgi:hypothetical protein
MAAAMLEKPLEVRLARSTVVAPGSGRGDR